MHQEQQDFSPQKALRQQRKSTPRRFTSLPRTPVRPTLGNNIQYGIQQPVDPHPIRLLP